MTSSAMTYPDWKAPSEDGETLIWPAPAEIARQTIANRTALSRAQIPIQNLPLSELRRAVRGAMGHDDANPLIADGHQTELYHAGVWVKTVMANQIAAHIGGSALHLAVDTDAPKHLSLRWPGGSAAITQDPQLTRAHWCSQLQTPSADYLNTIESDLAAYRFQQAPMIGHFLATMRHLSNNRASLSANITAAEHALDQNLGLKHQSVLASPIWESDGFLIFAHHLIARAGKLAAAYNAALAEYRRANKVRTTTRPMPDLAAYEDSVELPLWLDELETGGRTRPTAFACEQGYVITIPGGAAKCDQNDDEFFFDPAADALTAAQALGAWLQRNKLRFSPRALVLTMFIRLCAADQFIHGIGGGRYDQVTDRIIADFFQIEPPRFSVTTATMYLPEAAGIARICVPCIEREGHALRHAVLGHAKKSYLEKIDQSPRHSRERYETFVQMHRELAGAVATAPSIQAWQLRLEEAEQRESAEGVLFDRELFYAIQPQARLSEMIDHYAAEFDDRSS